MARLQRTVNFLDFMVRAVFVSTFVFTVVVLAMAWVKEWEGLATTTVERWFTVMVGELIVMGFIQIAKEVMQARVRQAEIERGGNE